MKRIITISLIFALIAPVTACVTKSEAKTVETPAAGTKQNPVPVKPVAVPAEKKQSPPPPRRYFRPAANETPVLPKISVSRPTEPVSAKEEKSGKASSYPEPEQRAAVRIIDRSALLKNVKSDSFYFSAMVFRFDTENLSARLQFERVPNRSEFTALAQQKLLFETFFPSGEFYSAAEKQISLPGGGNGFEIVVRAQNSAADPLETLAGLLSLLLQRPIEVSESGSPASPICEFSFACDPVMTFSSPNSYGMYTNAGGERVTFSFNLRNDSEVWFRLAY